MYYSYCHFYLKLSEFFRKFCYMEVTLVFQMSVNVDVYKDSERNINYQVPRVYAILSETIITNTRTSALTYNINLVGFEYIWQSYVLTLQSLICRGSKNKAVVSFVIPWLNASQHYIAR